MGGDPFEEVRIMLVCSGTIRQVIYCFIYLAFFAQYGNVHVMKTSIIRRLRLEQGMTLSDLAVKAGLSEGHMSRVEAGTRGLRPASAEKLARILGIPVSDLTGTAETAFVPDLVAYTPPKGSVVAKALASSTQRMFRVLTGVMSELAIAENDLIVAETNEKALKSIENGTVVVALTSDDDDTDKQYVLRQYIEPNLLITNSLLSNALPIHMLNSGIKVIGIVLR